MTEQREHRSVQPDMSQSLLLQALEQMSGIDHRLGVLSGQVGEVIREQSRVADGRKAIYEKINRIDWLSNEMARIAPQLEKINRIDGLLADMARIAPQVADHEKKSNQSAGALSLGRTILAMGSGAFGAFIAMVAKWLTDGPSHHP